jgi:hypothetical protein
MTKKHFIALADAIKRESGQNAAFNRVQIETLASFCQSTNPRFSRQRWLDYIDGKCGPNGGKPKGDLTG